MSNQIRVIPCLDVHGGRVVKGVNFIDLRDAGDPVELAAKYCSEGADELVFLDISATVEQRATTYEMVRKTAEQVSVPFCVGGGIRSIDDVELLLNAGANKVGINTAAISRPQTIDEIVARFGSQALVLALDVSKDASQPSGFGVVTHGGRQAAGLDGVAWAVEAVERGVGEILVTSLDADGTTDGFDLEVIRALKATVDVGVIASGGAGNLQHFVDAAFAGADAVLAASVFHFGTVSIAEVKQALTTAGFTTSR
ncbi:MAG: imidazole glycerol phosphate synthase subunit HisF [Propionibacteriaceae bacterium]|nr:imidazole glycerol phosphate synthase subunit HisF [Propionibacteriaceae bacterium]